MTKCIVLGESQPEEKKKPIEFVSCFSPIDNDPKYTQAPYSDPHRWGNVELIRRGDGATMDIMFAYDYYRKDGAVYGGHWNDGFVEE
jgi:hypothetical protein